MFASVPVLCPLRPSLHALVQQASHSLQLLHALKHTVMRGQEATSVCEIKPICLLRSNALRALSRDRQVIPSAVNLGLWLGHIRGSGGDAGHICMSMHVVCVCVRARARGRGRGRACVRTCVCVHVCACVRASACATQKLSTLVIMTFIKMTRTQENITDSACRT